MYILQRNGNVEIGKLLPPYTIILYSDNTRDTRCIAHLC